MPIQNETGWTIQEHRDGATLTAYQARALAHVRGQTPGSAPIPARALGPWHYLTEHGADEARRLAEADGAASGLPRAVE